MLKTTPINFKSDSPQKSIFNNSKPQAPMPIIPYETDVLELQNVEKEMRKKQKTQERLNKISAYGTAAIGIGIIGSLIFSIVMAVKGAKGGVKSMKITWDDIAKKENFPSLDDPCVNKKVREFIKNIKETAGLSDDVMKRAGVDQEQEKRLVQNYLQKNSVQSIQKFNLRMFHLLTSVKPQLRLKMYSIN